ncbi:MAG TPA: SUMF1/EgtB/PvdO family nonheme iron enzyme [Desulfurivibrionaceae bacterium]|nr:SUMF1/EgtB/PvdO family nonheme iron enzyme [Desulfurivibrionaceae bacterium]
MFTKPSPTLPLVFFLLLLFTLAARPGWAAEPGQPARLSVAVMEFNVMGDLGAEGGGAIVAEWLVSALGESKVFALRERVLLKKVLAEQQLALTGLMDEGKAAAKIGKLYGLDAVISGSIFRWGSTITVTARLIDSETGAIKGTAEIRAGNLDAVPARIKDLARVLTGQATQAEIDAGQACALGPKSMEAGAKLELGCTTWTEPTTGLEFILIKGGCYQMGQSEQEKKFLLQEYGEQNYAKLYADESPRHEVCVDDFWLAKYETTNRQFRLFRPEHNSLDYRGRTMNDDRQPTVYTSWEDAHDFAAWLSAKYQDRTFRLPTEAEWEKGCRSGTETPRFWGWDSDEACRFANVHDRGAEKENRFGWPAHDCDDGFVVTAPVGSLAPNPAGLYDMLGNAWEWTQDMYRPDYNNHGRDNPVINDGGTNRVRRGGSWNNETGSIRCANRGKREANRQNSRIGFRLSMQTMASELKEIVAPQRAALPLVELELVPERTFYKFKFTNQIPTAHALVISSPMPPKEKVPNYADISVTFKVFDGDQQLLAKTSPAMARYGAEDDGEYGAFFVTYLAPTELPLGKKLTATVEITGPLAEFLARRGESKVVLVPAPE